MTHHGLMQAALLGSPQETGVGLRRGANPTYTKLQTLAEKSSANWALDSRALASLTWAA